MIEIADYILRPLADRQAHLKLDEACVERGGSSTDFRGLLAYVLGTTIPKGMKVHCCHACHNGKCSNPKHMYWGTPSENRIDAEPFLAKKRTGKSSWANVHPDKAREHYRKMSALGVLARKRKRLLLEACEAGASNSLENCAPCER